MCSWSLDVKYTARRVYVAYYPTVIGVNNLDHVMQRNLHAWSGAFNRKRRLYRAQNQILLFPAGIKTAYAK